MCTLETDLFLVIISGILVIFGLSIGIVSILIVQIPRFDFLTGVISSLLRKMPKTKSREILDKYLTRNQPDPDYCTRLMIGLGGAILSFAIVIFPIVFYDDIRLFLFFFCMDIILGILGLAYYRVFVCSSCK